MARGVKLDRRKRYEVAHGVGIPVVMTKGNIYIDDSSGNIWLRRSGGSWETASGFWDRNSNTLTPSNVGDGLSVSASSTNPINLSTSDSDISIVASGSTGNLNLETDSSGVGNFTFTTNSASGNVLFDLNGGNSTFTVDTSTASDGSINLTTVGSNVGDIDLTGRGDVTIESTFGAGEWPRLTLNSSSGNAKLAGETITIANGISASGGINIYAAGNTADVNLTVYAGTDHGDIYLGASGTGTGGNISVRTLNGSGVGDISFTTAGTNGDFSIKTSSAANGAFLLDSNNAIINAPSGFLLTNADLDAFTTGVITTVADAGGGDVLVSGNPHFLFPRQSVTIAGTTDYNGTYTVKTTPSTTSFTVTATYTSSQTGTFSYDKSLGDEGPAWIKMGDQSTYNPLHIYSSHSNILLETVASSCTLDIILKSSDDIILEAAGNVNISGTYDSDFTISANRTSELRLDIVSTNSGTGAGNVGIQASDGIELVSSSLSINGSAGANFNGAVTNITVVNGIVTAAS